MQSLIAFVAALWPPLTLQMHHQDMQRSLQAQQAFFKDWQTKGSAFSHNDRSSSRHPQVQKASGHLHSAYNQLMQTFPNEDNVNKAAFFDYHCALDFI